MYSNTRSLVEAYDNFLSRPDELSSNRPGLWPSEASVEYLHDDRSVVHGSCMRSVWYRVKGYPTGCVTSNSMMKMKVGKALEKMIVDDFKRMGLWKGNNIKFWNDEFKISGELDLVLATSFDPQSKPKTILLEIKSFYGYNANKELTGIKRPPVPGKPKIDHFLQDVVYAYAFRDKIDEFRLFYIERGDGHRIEFEVGLEPLGDDFKLFWRQIPGPYWTYCVDERVYTRFTLEDIKKRWRLLTEHIAKNKLPPRDYQSVYDTETVEWHWAHGNIGKTKYEDWKKNKEKLGDWQCSYCEFSKQCSKDIEF